MLFPFAVVGGCGLAGLALPTDAISDTTSELPGLVEFGGAAPSTELLATTSPLATLRTAEGEDGPGPDVVAPSPALTDADAKPR